MKPRKDDFETRRAHIQTMSDEELKAYFFELTHKVVDPMMDLAHKHTSKSIERSILLRMGFSSIQATQIVDILSEHNLLRKGAGHCIYRLAKDKDMTILEAGTLVLQKDGAQYLSEVFKV